MLPRVECDEIWAFCYSKAKNVPEEHRGTFGYGNVWTWTAICADTKLVPTWLVGERHVGDAFVFMTDLADRLANRVQLTTDGHKPYLMAVEGAFGGEIDYAMLLKEYGPADGNTHQERKYSPNVCTSMETKVISGTPDRSAISTSYVERQNLTMRMGMRRFTRLTNAFSKKVENLAHAVSLHYMYYNFARVHQSLTIVNDDGTRPKRTPAMAAGVSDHVWTLREIAALLDSN
jgi:IS1 family transposase